MSIFILKKMFSEVDYINTKKRRICNEDAINKLSVYIFNNCFSLAALYRNNSDFFQRMRSIPSLHASLDLVSLLENEPSVARSKSIISLIGATKLEDLAAYPKIMLAHWINAKQIPLEDLELEKETLLEIAPHLIYADCRNIEIPPLFIEQCTRAEHLFANSDELNSINALSPYLLTLNLSGCSLIERVPLCSKLQTLILNCCKISDLNIAHLTDLTELQISGCKVNALDTSKNPRLQKVDISYTKIASVNFVTNLELLELDISGSKIDAISLLKNTKLRKFRCKETELKAIDLSTLTDLVELYCSKTKITKLDLSNNILLEIVHAGSLGITELDVSTLKYLKNLLLEKCKLFSLDVSQNTRLEILDISSNAHMFEINLSQNDALIELYCVRSEFIDLYLHTQINLKKLVCYLSFNLKRIIADSLDSCECIDCENCPDLIEFPQLPATAQVHTDSTNFHTFTVDSDKLEKEPLKVLLDLATIILDNKLMPSIIWQDPFTKLPSIATDLGGLRRAFFYTLFEHLFREGSGFSFTTQYGGKLPLLDENGDATPHRALGRVIALCATSHLLLGDHLPPCFYDALLSVEENSTLDAARSKLNRFPDSIVKPIYFAALEFHKTLGTKRLENWREKPLYQFVDRVQGMVPTKQTFLDKLDDQQPLIKKYFDQFITEHPNLLSELVEMITGAGTLGELPFSIVIKFELERLPMFHTCGPQIDIPLYPSYEHFKRKMIQALTSNKQFQIS